MQDHKVLHDWLSRRKISENVVKEFNVHWGTNPSFGPCVVIPICDDSGKFSFNKYRRNPLVDMKPKYLYDKGCKTTLYCADKIKESKLVLVTEGEMDCLVARSANIDAVSSTGGALSFPTEWRRYFEGKEVVLCFDNDPAGGEGMVKALEVIPWAKVLFLPDRAGVKDISDYVANGGDLGALMKTAVSMADMQAVVDNKSERQSTWQSVHFHEAYIKRHTESVAPVGGGNKRGAQGRVAAPGSFQEKIYSAKAYPIRRLIKFTKNKAKCLWHNEKTESMHYYSETNTVYCFGCGKSADAIDVYRQLTGKSFNEAVKYLK